jgi:hypothetical protein
MEDLTTSSSGMSTAAEFSAVLDEAFSSTDSEGTEATETEQPVEEVQDVAEPVEEVAEPQETEDAEAEQSVEEEKPVDPDVPEDVRVRERNGRKEFVLKESRYQTVYGGYQTAKAAESVFGEPLTEDLARSLQADRVAQIQMATDFLSPDPADHGRFLQNFAQMAEEARKSGYIAHDPFETLAQQFVPFLEQHNPAALKNIEAPITERFFSSMRAKAAQQLAGGKKDLMVALQWLEREHYNRYTSEAELAKMSATPDPLEARERSITEREQAITQQQSQAQQQRYVQWQNDTAAGGRAAIANAVDEVISPIAEQWAKFPNGLKGIKQQLHQLVVDAIKQDPAWVSERKADFKRALYAQSEQARAQIRGEIERRYGAKARIALDVSRNPRVKEILAEAAQREQARNAQTHARAAEAAKRREPGSLGAPAPTKVSPPKPNGMTATQEWKDMLERSFR